MYRKEFRQTDLGCLLKLNTILNHEKLSAFSSRSKTRVPKLITSIPHCTESYHKLNKKQTQKDYRLKRKSKFIFVFEDSMIIYVENRMDSTNKQSE